MPAATDAQVAAAHAYERLHVPALFQEWVDPVLDAAAVGPGDRVLDVACGTGVLTRAALARIGGDGAAVGVDPDPGMLAVAERLAPEAEWRIGTAEALPFDPVSFDVVASQFGMMFFVDRVGAIREMLRVLDDGGRIAVAVWDSLENQPSYAEEVKMLERIAGRDAADALRAPFVLGDPDELRALFEQAGASDVEVSTRTGEGRFPSVRAMVEADLRGWLPVMGVELSEAKVEEILAEAEEVLGRFVAESGEVVFPSPAHVVSARKG
jgi:ubiquinone/menaquinone biosynthesis C-methylase UbiE